MNVSSILNDARLTCRHLNGGGKDGQDHVFLDDDGGAVGDSGGGAVLSAWLQFNHQLDQSCLFFIKKILLNL